LSIAKNYLNLVGTIGVSTLAMKFDQLKMNIRFLRLKISIEIDYDCNHTFI